MMKRHLRYDTAAGECRSIVNGINRWWRVWTPKREYPGADCFRRNAKQKSVSGQGNGAFELLLIRMETLQLEVNEVVRLKPAMFQHLTRVCTNCGCKTECEQDIARELAGKVTQGWENYCPNAGTLHAIGALTWFGIMGAAGR